MRLAFAAMVVAGLCMPQLTLGDGETINPGQLRSALQALNSVSSGRSLLARARGFWKFSKNEELLQVLKWGESSRTDAVLTRHFNPKSGEEVRERQVSIFIRTGQTLQETILDLSHELIHATGRPSWDPYDPTLTPGKYIFATIEGEGGEVDAVVSECQVGLELSIEAAVSGQRCKDYLNLSTGRLEREKIKEDFYRVGRWRGQLTRQLREEVQLFPALSSEAPRLYSSTGHAPYPVALYREFEEITEIACENSIRRIQAASPTRGGERSPATSDSTQTFLKQRCKAAASVSQ